jgi:Cu+-exporting ATPase
MSNNIQEMKFKAEGITCSSCAEDMEKLLSATDGIVDASVSFKDEIINVRYDPEIIDRRKVFFKVRKLGYTVKVLSG